MSLDESYEGFVPITIILPGQRITGKAWKDAGHRLLHHIEEGRRQFLPIVDAEITDLTREEPTPEEHPVIAVNTRAITCIMPGDAVTPIAKNAAGRRAAVEA